jgi:hypothetical protein
MSKRDGMPKGVLSLVITIASILIGGIIGRQCVNLAFKTTRPRVVNEAKWERQPLYGTDMVMELPGKPNEIRFDISAFPPQVRDVIIKMKGYEYTRRDLVVMTSHAQYIDGFVGSSEGAARAGLEDMKSQKPTSNLQYQLDNRDPDNIIITGSLNWEENTPFDLNGFTRRKGERMWTLFVLSKRGDRESESASARILKSVTIF